MRRVHIITGIGKQLVALTVRLLVIKRLIVGKRLGKIEDMNPSVHILMNQADELEIPGRRKDDRKGLSPHHRRSGHAGRTIVGGWIHRKSRTPISKKWARLVGY